MSGIDIDISIEAGRWDELPEAEALVERACRTALTAAAPNLAGGAISLLLTDDAAVRILNRDWRGKDKPTNVLSFPGDDPLDGPLNPDLPPPQIGDIALALETIRREALDQQKPVDHHLTHLVVHGTLHLLGYDHEEEEEATEMEALETAILAGFGIPDPYLHPEDRLTDHE
jgi:probable rRNA maturation factor